MHVQPFYPNVPTHSWPFLPQQVLCIMVSLRSCLPVVSYWPFCSFLDAWISPAGVRNESVLNARFVFMNKNKNWGQKVVILRSMQVILYIRRTHTNIRKSGIHTTVELCSSSLSPLYSCFLSQDFMQHPLIFVSVSHTQLHKVINLPVWPLALWLFPFYLFSLKMSDCWS